MYALYYDQALEKVQYFQAHLSSVHMLLTGKMAVPPAYADLGKSAKDIFNKGYGNWKRDKRLLYKCVFFAPQRMGGCLTCYRAQNVDSHFCSLGRFWTG